MKAPERIGRYQVLRRLGGGGMGTVFLGRDPELDRLVALKLLKDDLSDNPELRERFTREARSAAKLRHPNIVTIFDIGEYEGQAFIAMEHVPGEALSDAIRRGAQMPLTRKLALMEMLCAGLHHAHRAGIVHRDIKPANLMVDGDGVLKIVDFGIARVADSSMTRDGMLVGSINYMSPEQIFGKPVDHRCDVFAVGAVFYELLTCQLAFPGSLADGLFTRICQEPPAPLSTLCPGIDQEIVRVVDSALQKDAAARYQDLSAMARDIVSIRARLGPESSDSSTAAMTSAATMPLGATPAPYLTPAYTPSRTPSGTPAATPMSGARITDSQRPSNVHDPVQRQRIADIRSDAAQMALDRREYAKAETLIEQAAAFDPSSQTIAALREQIQKAAADARDTDQRRKDVEEIVAAARVAMERGDFTTARAHLDRARRVAPKDQRVHALAGRLQRAMLESERSRAAASAVVSHGAVHESGSRLPLVIIGLVVFAATIAVLYYLQ